MGLVGKLLVYKFVTNKLFEFVEVMTFDNSYRADNIFLMLRIF